MATTQNTYTGNGSNKLFSITFPYLETSDIDVYLNNVLQTITTQYSFANATTIEFVTAPPNGATVKIDRTTDDSELPATFFPGSSIKAADLNADFDQTLYVVQEINNKAVKLDDPLYVNKTYIDAADATKVNKSGDTMSGNLAMSGNLVTGLGTPSSDADSATKKYVDDRYGQLSVPGVTRWRKTATAGQTTFSGAGEYGGTLAYSSSRETVYVNGALQQRNVDYTANDGATIVFTPALLLGDVVEVHCVNNAAGVTTDQASGIYWTQTGSGATTRTVDSKLKDIVNVSDFGGDLEKAIDALPSEGGTVYIGPGTFVSPYPAGSPLTKNNVTILGAGRPSFKSDLTGLEGGTILRGTFAHACNGLTVKDLGIDCGSAVCTAFYGGTAQEGLISSDSQAGGGIGDAWLEGNRIENVSVICKDSAAAVHAFLFENQRNGSFENIHTVYAASGIVIKGTNINANDIYSRGHNNYSFLIKSDWYATSEYINASNILIESVQTPTPWDTGGLVLLSTSAGGGDGPVENININNITLKNTKDTIYLNAGGGSYIKNVNISNFTAINSFFAGFATSGTVSQVILNGGQIIQSDYGVLVEVGASDVFVSNVLSKQSGHNCFSNLGTGVVFENCIADTPYSINYVGFNNAAGSSIVRTPNYRGITTNKVSNTSGTQTIEDIGEVRDSNATVFTYLRKKLIAEIEAITGSGSILGAWFGPADGITTVITDFSTNGTRTGTMRNGSLVATPKTPTTLGMGVLTDFDAACVWDTPDVDAFSFGNGTTDSAFSIMAVTKPVATYISTLLGKSSDVTGSTQKEWHFIWANTSGLQMLLYDDSTGGYIARRWSSSLDGDAGTWHNYAATYSGSSTAAGIKVYRDGTEVTNSDISSGSYTAMENKGASVGSYVLSAGGAVNLPMTQSMAVTLIWNVELSAADVSSVKSLLTAYFGV